MSNLLVIEGGLSEGEREKRYLKRTSLSLTLWPERDGVSSFANMDELSVTMHYDILAYIIARLPNLEILFLKRDLLFFTMVESIDGNPSTPFHCLTHSLKRIHVPFNESINKSISARNALWLLVFCEGLEEAAIGCSLDKNNDAAYLKEYSQDFKGLSRVKKLAIGFEVIWKQEDKSSWWRPSEGEGERPNIKSTAIQNFLLVTN